MFVARSEGPLDEQWITTVIVKRCSYTLLRQSLASSTFGLDAAQALLAVKELGKNPAGSEFLATPENLSTLLSLAASFKDDPEASSEALRSVANAVFLVEKARSTIFEKEVDGGVIVTTMLESPFVRNLVEDKFNGRTAIDIIASKLDILTPEILAGTRMAKEAMSDILKLAFNLLLYYPKMVRTNSQTAEASTSSAPVIGDYWSPKLDGILAPALRAFTSIPSTSPSPIAAPLTHVIHALITIPFTTELRPIWFGTNTITSPRSSTSNSPKSRSQMPQPATAGNDQPPHPASPKPSTLDRALSVLAAGRRSLSRSPPTTNTTGPTNVVQRTYDLVDTALAHFFPDAVDVDEQSVRDRAKWESPDNTLDDLLSPIVILLTRICAADEASRVRIRQLVIPDDLDRSAPLEGRADILGRCLRLMGSIYQARLKDSIGELLFAMCDSDASILSALVGYGNVAGFLYHKGVLSAPAAPSSSTFTPPPSSASINPITGTTNTVKPDLPDMTDEEKEREAEKLFVLFDRLEKTGALPPNQNPMRKAIQEGKISL
ncbi:hypothetical protein H0H92_001775 [Tricholoma furcatifolium]|nr:hypothetical protein H0H92_001775 [Tricholoma furcatifolium]